MGTYSALGNKKRACIFGFIATRLVPYFRALLQFVLQFLQVPLATFRRRRHNLRQRELHRTRTPRYREACLTFEP